MFFQGEVLRTVERVVDQAQYRLDSAVQDVRAAAEPEGRGNAAAEQHQEHPLEEFVDSQKSDVAASGSHAETREKNADGGIPFGFYAMPREFPKKGSNRDSKPFQVTATAVNVASQAATAATTAAATAATVAAQAATQAATAGLGAVSSGAAKQFQTARETLQTPLSRETRPRQPRQKPIGNFKQTVSQVVFPSLQHTASVRHTMSQNFSTTILVSAQRISKRKESAWFENLPAVQLWRLVFRFFHMSCAQNKGVSKYLPY